MSTPITEYVHFYQSHYDEWGINRIYTVKSGTLEASFSQIKNQISNQKELISLLTEAKQIQQQYNNLFFPKVPTDFSNILAQIAQETLQEQFGAAAGRINSSNFNVESTSLSSEYKNKVKQVREKINVENLKKEATVKQILNAINKLSQVLLNLDNSNNVILKTRLAQGKNELNQIKKRIANEANLKNINFSNDIETINKLIQQFNRSFTWYNQRGDLFEWLLPLIQLKGTKLAGDELKKAMKSLIGSNNLGADYSTIEFSDFLNLSEPDSSSINTKKIKMQIVNVRNKTDVIVKLDTGNGQYKNINVSAKSVSGKHIKLVDETSLYRILVFSQNYDFIKHYLNIISWSEDGGRASQEQIMQANRLVKGLIMQLAAQGFDLNNPSELLIMHDVKEKRINVYNIKALVYIIKQNIILGNSKYSNLIKGFDENFSIKQSFENTVQKRLNFLFNEINKQKITAHIYGTQLKDYIKLLNTKKI